MSGFESFSPKNINQSTQAATDNNRDAVASEAPAMPPVVFTTSELIAQGYSPEFARDHPLNANNIIARKIEARREERDSQLPSAEALRAGGRLFRTVVKGGIVLTPDERARLRADKLDGNDS